MQHEETLSIKPQKSWYLLILMLVLHGGALFSLFMVPIFWWLKVLVTLLVIAHFIYWLRRDYLCVLPGSIIGCSIVSQGYQLHFANNQTRAAKLLSSSVVTRFVMVLSFITEGRMRSIVLLPDSLTRAELRQLRVRLWYSKKPDM